MVCVALFAQSEPATWCTAHDLIGVSGCAVSAKERRNEARDTLRSLSKPGVFGWHRSFYGSLHTGSFGVDDCICPSTVPRERPPRGR